MLNKSKLIQWNLLNDYCRGYYNLVTGGIWKKNVVFFLHLRFIYFKRIEERFRLFLLCVPTKWIFCVFWIFERSNRVATGLLKLPNLLMLIKLESITSQKLSPHNFWRIANNVLNNDKSAIPPLISCLSSASDKAK